MLTALKTFLKFILIPVLYIGGILIMLASIFKEALWGLYLLIALIPQPNIWYKFHEYFMGKDFIDLLFFAILIGLIIQRKEFVKTGNTTLIFIFIFVSYISLWNCSLNFSLPLPITTSNELLFSWKNYAQMIFMYFLVLTVVKEEDQQKVVVVIMALVILFLAIRSYRNFEGGASFSYDKREGGPFEAVLLGANHYGAFIAYYCSAFIGLFLFDKDRRRRILYLATSLFGLHPLFYSYSRGAYLAALGALTWMGIMKKRMLLVPVIIILLTWQSILPPSVVDRITMTETQEGELESSAAHRIVLWEHAIKVFQQNPIFGIGFGGFRFTVPEEERLTDTHNFYVKTLSEQGVIGGVLLLLILLKAFVSGWRLLKIGKTPFHQGLGLGFIGCVIAIAIANLFGDRFSYFVLGSYFWIFWGLVDRGIIISNTEVQPLN